MREGFMKTPKLILKKVGVFGSAKNPPGVNVWKPKKNFLFADWQTATFQEKDCLKFSREKGLKGLTFSLKRGIWGPYNIS